MDDQKGGWVTISGSDVMGYSVVYECPDRRNYSTWSWTKSYHEAVQDAKRARKEYPTYGIRYWDVEAECFVEVE